MAESTRRPRRTSSTPLSRSYQQLAATIARTTAVAWTIGVLALTALSVTIAARGYHAENDSLLLAYGLTAYALASFDDNGRLDTYFLDQEVEGIKESLPVTITIMSKTEGLVYGPPFPGADALMREAIRTEDEVWVDRGANRVFAIATYADRSDRVTGAVIASRSTSQANQATFTFALTTGTGAIILIGLGIWLSTLLSRQILSGFVESLQERERILAGAAHELRTPLATMLAVAESARPEDAPRALTQLTETVTGASALVNRLLTWSQLADARPELEPVRLDLLVELHLEPYEPYEATSSVVHADPKLLEIAIQNMIQNARIHGGGIVRVCVKGRVVEVHDRAQATIDPALLSPFTKGRASPGTGLGLALIQRIADVHGGELRLGPPVALELPEVA